MSKKRLKFTLKSAFEPSVILIFIVKQTFKKIIFIVSQFTYKGNLVSCSLTSEPQGK